MIHISKRIRETFIDIGSGTDELLMIVVVDDKPVASISLKPSQARELAKELIKHVKKIKYGRDTKENEQ